MNVLVVDVGGTNVKILATGQGEPRKLPSGTALTAAMMVDGVKKLAGDWKYDAVAIGYPGPVVHDRPMAEPHNLAPGWVEFDYAKAFGDHGEVGAPMGADGGDCETVLAAFAKAGVDVDAVAAKLQTDGAASFVASWNELMGVIASKSAALEKVS